MIISYENLFLSLHRCDDGAMKRFFTVSFSLFQCGCCCCCCFFLLLIPFRYERRQEHTENSSIEWISLNIILYITRILSSWLLLLLLFICNSVAVQTCSSVCKRINPIYIHSKIKRQKYKSESEILSPMIIIIWLQWWRQTSSKYTIHINVTVYEHREWMKNNIYAYQISIHIHVCVYSMPSTELRGVCFHENSE